MSKGGCIAGIRRYPFPTHQVTRTGEIKRFALLRVTTHQNSVVTRYIGIMYNLNIWYGYTQLTLNIR